MTRRALVCAAYTRTSSEEGLQQDFNSLDAQREASAAYTASQKHEGWRLSPTRYDDGGHSGGSMERPALQQLLQDIESGRIQVVVVYKIDRLTRSLADFARIVEVFDRRGVSFVSVTQHFNTTSSMGRLTLNVLLSFAQFEREITGERIRDKFAASRAKGMWMGGHVPLGYDLRERKLAVNEAEADLVRHIFGRYLALGCVRRLEAELDGEGRTSKQRTSAAGIRYGGASFSRGALHIILRNRTYIGEVVHKKRHVHPGQHAAIVPRTLWDQVQAQLDRNRARVIGPRGRRALVSLLAGLVYDADGNRLTPSHTNRHGRRYRYYAAAGRESGAPLRVRAEALEEAVAGLLIGLLRDGARLMQALEHELSLSERTQAIERARQLADAWPGLPVAAQRGWLDCLVDRLEVAPDRVRLSVWIAGVTTLAILPSFQLAAAPSAASEGKTASRCAITVDLPIKRKTNGMEPRSLIAIHPQSAKPDPVLVRAIARGEQIRREVVLEGRTLTAVARDAGVTYAYFARLLRLALLPPEITRGALEGGINGLATLQRSFVATCPRNGSNPNNPRRIHSNHDHSRAD